MRKRFEAKENRSKVFNLLMDCKSRNPDKYQKAIEELFADRVINNLAEYHAKCLRECYGERFVHSWMLTHAELKQAGLLAIYDVISNFRPRSVTYDPNSIYKYFSIYIKSGIRKYICKEFGYSRYMMEYLAYIQGNGYDLLETPDDVLIEHIQKKNPKRKDCKGFLEKLRTYFVYENDCASPEVTEIRDIRTDTIGTNSTELRELVSDCINSVSLEYRIILEIEYRYYCSEYTTHVNMTNKELQSELARYLGYDLPLKEVTRMRDIAERQFRLNYKKLTA